MNLFPENHKSNLTNKNATICFHNENFFEKLEMYVHNGSSEVKDQEKKIHIISALMRFLSLK